MALHHGISTRAATPNLNIVAICHAVVECHTRIFKVFYFNLYGSPPRLHCFVVVERHIIWTWFGRPPCQLVGPVHPNHILVFLGVAAIFCPNFIFQKGIFLRIVQKMVSRTFEQSRCVILFVLCVPSLCQATLISRLFLFYPFGCTNNLSHQHLQRDHIWETNEICGPVRGFHIRICICCLWRT